MIEFPASCRGVVRYDPAKTIRIESYAEQIAQGIDKEREMTLQDEVAKPALSIDDAMAELVAADAVLHEAVIHKTGAQIAFEAADREAQEAWLVYDKANRELKRAIAHARRAV